MNFLIWMCIGELVFLLIQKKIINDLKFKLKVKDCVMSELLEELNEKE